MPDAIDARVTKYIAICRRSDTQIFSRHLERLSEAGRDDPACEEAYRRIKRAAQEYYPALYDIVQKLELQKEQKENRSPSYQELLQMGEYQTYNGRFNSTRSHGGRHGRRGGTGHGSSLVTW